MGTARYITNNFSSHRKTLAELHSLEATLGTACEERRVNYISPA